MYIENKELIKEIIKNLSNEYVLTGPYERSQLSRDELINKLMIAETIVKIFEEKIRVLKTENNIWNSSDGFKVPRATF